MEDRNPAQNLPEGLSERVMREVLRTPALKELILLQLKDIDADAAPGLARTLLWEDPGVSLSLFGALPDAVNWLLEFLLEMGKQFNGLPEPLLRDFLGRLGEGIDQERLKELPAVYGQLLGRLLVDDAETASQALALAIQAVNAAVAGADQLISKLDENRENIARSMAAVVDALDPGALGRIFNRMVRLSNAYSRQRMVPIKEQCRAILSQMEVREVLTVTKNITRSSLSIVWSFISWSVRNIRGG
ncbi:MAG: hypothetical protein SWK76_09855 [Actinomycetota bacterium]|nr:hypothetical protein [Actinomycetota bacterium]